MEKVLAKLDGVYHPHGSISAWEWQVGLKYGIEL